MIHVMFRGVVLAILVLSCGGVAAQQNLGAPAQSTAHDDEAERIDRARYLFKFAVAAMKKGDPLVAEDKLREAAALVPDNALLWYNLGAVQARNHRVYPASQSLERALAIGLTGEDRDVAENLLIELTYALGKPPKEPRVLANVVFFDVAPPRGPHNRSIRIEGIGDQLATSLLRAIAMENNLFLRGSSKYTNAALASIPDCPNTLPEKMNAEKFAMLRAQWYQCIEAQIRSRATEIRDTLRSEGFSAFAVLAIEATEDRKQGENPSVTGTLYLVTHEGLLTKVERIAGTSVTLEGLPNALAARAVDAVQNAARSIRLLEPL